MAEAREGSRRATRWTCHGIRVSDDRKTSTTHEHAGPTCHSAPSVQLPVGGDDEVIELQVCPYSLLWL